MSRRVRVVALGGTIAMRLDQSGRQVPALSGAELAKRIDGSIHAVEVSAVASAQLTALDLHRTSRAVLEGVTAGDAIVVTVGTDALTDVAFYLAEALNDAPLVVTGAMRPSDSAKSDGPSNLEFAVKLAASGVAGTTVAVGGIELSAASAVKWHTVALQAFRGNETRLANHLGQTPAKPVRLASIVVLPVFIDTPGAFVDAARSEAIEGLVAEAMGTGSLPHAVRDGLLAAASDGLPVVLTTRALAGPVRVESLYPGAWADLEAHGVAIENVLRADKARLRLALSLSLGKAYVPARLLELGSALPDVIDDED